MTEQTVRTKWGRTTFGGGRFSAAAIAIPCGVMIAVLLGVVTASFSGGASSPALVGAVFALCLAVPSTLLVYVLVVDRSTMQGATDRPEESVESGWYDKAAAGALTDLVLLAGVTGTVLAIIPTKFPVDASLVLAGVVGVAFASVALRYLAQRHRG